MRYVPKIFPLPFSWYLTNIHTQTHIVDLIWIVSELRIRFVLTMKHKLIQCDKIVCVCVLVKWIVSDCSFCSLLLTHRILQISIWKMRGHWGHKCDNRMVMPFVCHWKAERKRKIVSIIKKGFMSYLIYWCGWFNNNFWGF